MCDKWRVAYFCSSCNHEMDSWDATTKECCPYCGATVEEGHITLSTYKKVFRYVKNPTPWWKRIMNNENEYNREWKD